MPVQLFTLKYVVDEGMSNVREDAYMPVKKQGGSMNDLSQGRNCPKDNPNTTDI